MTANCLNNTKDNNSTRYKVPERAQINLERFQCVLCVNFHEKDPIKKKHQEFR